MNSNPEPDKVLQEALDIFRDYLKSTADFDAEKPVQISVSAVLVEKGYRHSEAQRLYSSMKRLGLIEVVKTGLAYRIPTILTDMTTTVEQRRMERSISRRSRTRLTGIDAEIAQIRHEIAKKEDELKQLQRKEARLLKEKVKNSQLQPTN